MAYLPLPPSSWPPRIISPWFLWPNWSTRWIWTNTVDVLFGPRPFTHHRLLFPPFPSSTKSERGLHQTIIPSVCTFIQSSLRPIEFSFLFNAFSRPACSIQLNPVLVHRNSFNVQCSVFDRDRFIVSHGLCFSFLSSFPPSLSRILKVKRCIIVSIQSIAFHNSLLVFKFTFPINPPVDVDITHTSNIFLVCRKIQVQCRV